MKPLYLLYTIGMFAVGMVACGVVVLLWTKTKETVLRNYLFFFIAFSLLLVMMYALPEISPGNHLFQEGWFDLFMLFSLLIYAVISVLGTIIFIRLYGPDPAGSIGTLTPHFEGLCQQYNITSREQEVIRLILQGRCNREISEDLMITVSTVKKYITSIYRKLDLKSRDELITLFTGV